MHCAKCGADNPAGKLFCGDCGAALANRCVRCGAENPPEKKFCGDCGSALGTDVVAEGGKPSPAEADGGVRIAPERQTSEAIDGERKTVTALFADIKGSTELMEDLDPEEARAIIDPALKLMIDAARRYDGYVVQSTGDGIFALFGAPVAHEDHPQRALYAAIRMQEEIKRFAERLRAEKGLNLQVRVGANAGEVVVRSIETGQHAVGRGLTKFVGREREMEALKHAAELARQGHGQIVVAMAEPGVGKSRLFFEFKATSQSGWMVLETVSVSYGKASAYLPLIDLLRNYFDITTTDDERKRREKVTGRVVALDRSLEDTLPYLFTLLGIVEGDDPLAQMDGQIKKRRTLEAIKRILLRESLNQPLMVVFEDLHWIDEQTQELLNLLADSIGTTKILLLVNYRPEYSHQWGSKTYYTQLRLDPLGREGAHEMLTTMVGDGTEVRSLKGLIIARTGGNPFFMEEIVQSLFEEGVLKRNGHVKLAKSMSAVKVPATVQAILASRIDRLPAEEKELLQTLAVFGREFALSLVRRVFDGRKNDELERMLADLQMAEFIYEQAATGDIEYIFKHALTQQVAYNSVLIERRKLLHKRAGEGLESMFAEQLDDHLDELAHHYSRSDNVAKAVEYLGRAGQQALQRSAYSDAINRLTGAIDRLQGQPDIPERAQRELLLQLALGTTLIAVKGFAAPEAEHAYIRARELCGRLGDPPELFPALFGLWAVHLVRGALRTAHELAEQLLRRMQEIDDPAQLLYTRSALGNTSFWIGEFRSAKEHLEEGISIYDPEQHRPLSFLYGFDAGVNCLSYAAWTLWHLGYPDQALKRGNEALVLAQGLLHPYSLAWAGFFVGIVHQYRREARAAQETAENVLAVCAEHGLTDFLAFATALRGWAMAAQGRNEDGIAQLQEGLAALRTSVTELAQPHNLCMLSEACREAGHLDDALSALKEALAAANEHEDRHHEAEIHRLKGELLLRQNDSNAAEAKNCFERAIGIAGRQSAKSHELRATMSLARLLAKQGRRDEARTMLTDIYGWFTEGFDTADLKDAKALLDELGIV